MPALLQPRADADALARLLSVYPQILPVARSDAQTPWADAVLQRAQQQSRAANGPALADVDFAQGHYRVVQAAETASYTLQIGIRSMVPWSEWQMAQTSSTFLASLLAASSHFSTR